MNMLKSIKTLDELMAEAIKIKNKEKVIVFWPQFNKHQEQAYTLTDDYFVSERTYNVNNGIIAFYMRNTLYVIPYFNEIDKILEAEGFKQSDMFVPFSNHEYPIENKEKWEAMIAEAHQLQEEKYHMECLEYATMMGISPIDQELLEKKCIAIPKEGVLVNHPDKEPERKFPVVCGYCCDNITLEHLGKYFVNVQNGVITFVNADGVQYITRSEEVHKQLFKKGYRFTSQFEEIFKDDEEPAEDDFTERWNKLSIA